MATRLYGVLLDGLKKPIVNATVVLLAKGNTITVLNGSEAIFKTDAQGAYNVTVQSGYYKVIIGPQGIEPYKAGEIAIYADSPEGSLNSYLVNWAEEDLTPEVIKQVKELVANSEQFALQAGRSAAAAQSDATDARNSKASAAQSASDALVYKNDSKANADAAKQAQAGAAGSANTANTALTTIQGIQKDVTASKDRAVTAESNAKSSENVATQAKTDAVTAKDQAVAAKDKAQQIADSIDPQSIKHSIGLGSSPRDCPDISGNPSGYVGFMRITSTATGFPSIASGEGILTGFISQVDGKPSYTGVFQGWGTRSLYTYRWNSIIGPEWTRHARKNEVDKLVQLGLETQLLNPDGKAKIFITSNKLWGAYDSENKKYIPLAIAQGGTGAVTLNDAKTNLQIPEGGLTKAMTLRAPEGAEDGKYYPVIIDASGIEGNGNLTCPVDIKTAGRAGTDPMNSNTFSGYFRCGGWTDTMDIACGSFVAYDKNELGILCLKVSRKDYPQYVAFYIHKAAFPILLQTGYKARVIVPTEDYAIGTSGVKYKFGVSTSEEGNNENAVKNALDFTGGESGFYSNLPFRQGRSDRFALTNTLNSTDPFIVTLPSFTIVGAINCTKGLIAYGEDVANRTITSRRTNAESNQTLDQSEFMAGNGQGEIVVRDINNSSNSKFFNFKLDGTFASPHGLAMNSVSWDNQHTDNVNKFKPIFGNSGGPSGATVVGGFHAQFSGNYVTQFAGRNSKFWARSFEAGVDKGWKRLLTVDDLNSATDLSVKSVTTSSPVKSGGGRIDVLGSASDYALMDCFVRGFNSTGNSLAWALGTSSGVSKMLSLKNFHSNAEVLLNGSDGAVQLKTGTVGGAAAQALTINSGEVNSTVDLTLTKQTGTGKRFILQNLGNTELSFAVKVWGSGDRQNVFEVGTSAAYLFYAQKTSQGQLFDVNGNINCVTLNQSSDRRLKENINVIADATGAIRKINGYTYTLKDGGSNRAGVIAQEVMEALPEAVGSFIRYGEELPGPTEDGNSLREEASYLNVDYSALTGLLVQFAREADDRISKLETEVEELKKLVTALVNKDQPLP